ncbi:MAG: M48 family metallopeptidase [Hyphomicrobium sp.]
MLHAGASQHMPLLANGLSEIDAPVEVRRHPGARRMTLRVSRTRRAVIVTVPPQCDLGDAGTFLHRNIGWVRERLAAMPEPVPFEDGAIIPLRNHRYRIVCRGRRRGESVVTEVPAGPCSSFAELHVAGDREHAPRRLADWLIGEARRDLDAAVSRHARFLGFRPVRIAVKDQASRWGSCSTTGVLSFSWRLILAPSAVLDYVAAHEVAHLGEMNHGPRFWALVKRTYPQLDEARRWLHVHGMELHRYGGMPGRD